MSGNKAALKAAKTALDNEKWDEAITQAQVVLASDPQNYFAKLFLGRAFEKKGELEDASQAYHSAAKIKPDDQQAWQGLCSLYESQGAKKVDEFGECSVQLAGIFARAEDAHRCQVVIDKLTGFAKKNGTPAQYKRALMVQLPGSPVYDFLEGRLPHPSFTFTRLAEMTEDEEKQRINKEIGERRTRLGARIGQVTAEVKREVYDQSDLEQLYRSIIDWTNDDEARREYEEKIFVRAYDTLIVLPSEQKAAKREQVVEMARGMVVVKHPFRTAWDLELEWKDIANVQDLDVYVLREYIEFFPESGLTKVLRAYLDSEVSPFPQRPKEEQDEEEDKEEPLSSEDRLLLMGDGLGDGKGSALANRLVGEYYLHLEEYDSAADTARNGLKLVTAEEQKAGLDLQNNRDALNSVLGTALVHFQAPRNHPEAKAIFDEILQRKPKSTAALIGLGLILEEQEHYEEAGRLLSQALSQDPDNIQIGAEAAWCNALSGEHAQALEALEKYLPEMKLDNPKARDLRAQTLYRIGICMWELDPSKAARKDRNGAYARFLSAIKTNVNFAPAYASLGFYYADYARDKKRARQCFQKAFELSASEVEAAERLARAFADAGEWDIVEIISQRVVDSGKVRPPPGSKKKGISWPYSALGVVQMTKQEYAKAIVSFLSALRISPDDYHSYVGLGESYHNSGRYNSASRTFHYAEEPHDGIKMKVSGESWFTEYMLANVHRELGEYEEAITGLQKVLEGRPEEFGVLVALLQTFVETAWRCIETGFFGQATTSANMALELATKIGELRPSAFNLWKAVGDACSIFAWAQGSASAFPTETVRQLLAKDIEVKELDILGDIDRVRGVSLENLAQTNGDATDEATPDYLILSLLAYKRAIHSCTNDLHAQAVAWYNLGWAEQKAYSVSGPKAGKRFSRAAIRCFKRAIELEAGNSEFWNALGVVTTRLNPKVAQHAFVRSLYLNERSVRVWTNLGVLYLLNNDYELAHQAFARAQSTDPDYAHAWMGEGMIALLMGDSREALSHFTHAFDISDAASLIVKRQYAVSVFDNLLSDSGTSNNTTDLIQPLFALQQLHSQAPSDLEYRHLAALYSERVSDHLSAISSLEQICTSAEATYEATESSSSLAHFAHAKADLARNQLATHDFASAAENASTALDLSSESSDFDLQSRRKLRLSAHLTSGLAAYNLTDTDAAIASFRSALEESDSDPDIVCLLVQVLWAKGGDEERAVARDTLFSAIESHPEHVGAVVLLGAIAALDGDVDTIEAAREDLVILRASEDVTVEQRRSVENMLAALAVVGSGGNAVGNDDEKAGEAAGLKECQVAVMLAPHTSLGWAELAEYCDEPFPAEMALLTAQRAVPPYGNMDAVGLSKAFAGTGLVGDAQRAVMLAPWRKDGWEAFAEALSV